MGDTFCKRILIEGYKNHSNKTNTFLLKKIKGKQLLNFKNFFFLIINNYIIYDVENFAFLK